MLDRLYAILDVALCRERGLDPLATLDGFLAGGARLIQLRDKSPSSAARLELADAVAARVRSARGRLIVNDRPDIAVMCGADGVHVGQDDLGVADARAIVGGDRIVGVSTHDAAQIAAAAQTDATYIAVGPVFTTATKDTGYSARGVDLVRMAARHGRPVVAIGGITLDRAAEVLAAGAASVAVISDLVSGPPADRVRRFLTAIDGAAGRR
jgi:thiamine-phosphate pyrophosphorylase